MDTARWSSAQTAEKKYWNLTKETWSTDSRRKEWQEKLAHGFNLSDAFFTDKTVLEIGPGPSGLIFLLDNAKSRIGLEPMDMSDLIEQSKKLIVTKGVGEELPFPRNSFEIVLCFNALDHCRNPTKVIQEVHRVLQHGGEFLLWLYILRHEYKFLQGILNKFDPPHPHHFTVDEILSLLKDNSFHVTYKKYEKGMDLHNYTIKTLIGNFAMATVWLWAKKG
jgi:SAM-dependent methyltransferase